MYRNPQGEGLFIVIKFHDGEVDTGSYTGSYRHKPAARTYNTFPEAKKQRTRYRKEGYVARIGEITFDGSGTPSIAWVDEEEEVGPPAEAGAPAG